MQSERFGLTDLQVFSRHPEDYLLVNERDGSRWRGDREGKWQRESPDRGEPLIALELNQQQADAVSAALELYTRLGLGQWDQIPELLRSGVVPQFSSTGEGERTVASDVKAASVGRLAEAIKLELGYPTQGSHGIGHPHNHQNVTRVWEAKRTLDRALAMLRGPNVRYGRIEGDSLDRRGTFDPPPVARIVT